MKTPSKTRYVLPVILPVVILAAIGALRALADPPERIRPRPEALPIVNDPAFGMLAVSRGTVYKNMTVHVLAAIKAPKETPRDYITLAEGVKAGLVKITEDKQERVRRLLITNLSEKHLFIQVGELVTGGKQDRTLQTSLVVPPKTGPVPIPSFCVEQSRWSGGKGFIAPGIVVADQTANVSAQTGSQDGVWRGVSSYKRRAAENVGRTTSRPAKASRSSSIKEELQDGDFKRISAAYEEALGHCIRRVSRPRGVVIVVDGKITAAHLYHSTGLFRKLWPMLLKSASAQAAAGKIDKKTFTTVTLKNVVEFLKSARSGKKMSQELDYGNVYVRWVGKQVVTSQLNYKGEPIHAQVLNAQGVRATPRPVRQAPARQQMNRTR